MTTLSTDHPRRRTRGFTLVEVLICAGIAGFVLTAILSAFLFMGRSAALMSNYVKLEQEARRGLERFGEDTRMASAINSTSGWPNRVTLTVPNVSGATSNTVKWWWEQSSGANYHAVMREERDSSGNLISTQSVMPNVKSFQFDRWTAGSASGVQASGDPTTDQLQIHLTIELQASEAGVKSKAVAAATNLVVSARYILRNKH